MQTRLGSLFCLFLLLGLFIVPLAHQGHLQALEEPYPTIAAAAAQKVGPRLSAPEPEKTDHHHDAASCSICQAAIVSRQFFAPVTIAAPNLVLPVHFLGFCDSTLGFASPEILPFGSRSPPSSL
jgi:hypothetical protein